VRIDQLIRQGIYPGVEYLAREFEVSNRTIYRDLSYLKNTLEAPLKFDKEKKGYYYSQKTWSLPSILFSEAELIALSLARLALDNLTGLPYENNLNTAMEKILNCLPAETRESLSMLNQYYSFRSIGARHYDIKTLDLLSRSIKKRHSVKIRYYTSGRNEEMERVVDPYHLDNLKGDWYLIGFCHLRKALRVFSVNRILKIYPLDISYEIDPDFSYQEYIHNTFGIMHSKDPVDVQVRFYGLDARLIKERHWHDSQKCEEMDDGSVIIQLHVCGLEEVKRWALYSGENAEVIKPEWFRKQIYEEILRMAERYQIK